MKKFLQTPWFNLLLFVLTLVTTTLAGAEHQNFESVGTALGSWDYYKSGLWYSIPFLLILGCHEFGHYFMAKHHKLDTSLPYFIPLWFFMNIIGTLGAVIRLRNRVIQTKLQFFDVGIAGPLAGFVVAMCFITYGFMSLPPREEIFKIHPEYHDLFEKHGQTFEEHAYTEQGIKDQMAYYQQEGRETVLLSTGSNLIFWMFENWVVDDASRIPNKYEMIHYPFLFAGFVALFFTALNLIPIGQLDGGHVLFGLIGYEKHKLFSKVFFTGFVLYAGLGIEVISLRHQLLQDVALYAAIYIGFLYVLFNKVYEQPINVWTAVALVFSLQFGLAYFAPEMKGYDGWLFFALILSRFLGVYHPKVFVEEPLDTKRKILGWTALLIFILCASLEPFQIEIVGGS